MELGTSTQSKGENRTEQSKPLYTGSHSYYLTKEMGIPHLAFHSVTTEAKSYVHF